MNGIIIFSAIMFIFILGTISMIIDCLYTSSYVEDSIDEYNQIKEDKYYKLENDEVYNDYLDE